MGDRKLKIVRKKDSFTPPTYTIEEYTETIKHPQRISHFLMLRFYKLNPLSFWFCGKEKAVKVRLNVRGEKMNCPF